MNSCDLQFCPPHCRRTDQRYKVRISVGPGTQGENEWTDLIHFQFHKSRVSPCYRWMQPYNDEFLWCNFAPPTDGPIKSESANLCGVTRPISSPHNHKYRMLLNQVLTGLQVTRVSPQLVTPAWQDWLPGAMQSELFSLSQVINFFLCYYYLKAVDRVHLI